MFIFPGHLAIGLIGSAFLSVSPLLFIIGNIIPDLDTIPYFFGVPYRKTHRTITHSVFMPLLVCLFSPLMALGVLTHLICDVIGYPGLKLFYPFSQKEYYFYRGNIKKHYDFREFVSDSLKDRRQFMIEMGLLVSSLFLF